jgi:ribonuclease P protein component
VGTSRVGIVVGKRFGGAVSRNRAKRLFRELTRQLQGQLLTEHSLVVFPKRDSIAQPFAVLKEMWLSSLQRHQLLRIHLD